MILQALVQYYEDLLANDKITRPGWTSAKVSWALELDENGQLMALHPLHQEEKRGKKPALVPLQLKVPEQVKRSRNIISNFMCENSAYMLGIGKKEKKEHGMSRKYLFSVATTNTLAASITSGMKNKLSDWDYQKKNIPKKKEGKS